MIPNTIWIPNILKTAGKWFKEGGRIYYSLQNAFLPSIPIKKNVKMEQASF
jgi:hypothetical protein